jgi:hypothetical protein
MRVFLMARPLLEIFNGFRWRKMKNPFWIGLTSGLVATQNFAGTPAAVDAYGFISFRDIDTDHNGYVSRVEARSVVLVENAFDSADANSDGLLDRGEYTSVGSVMKAN